MLLDVSNIIAAIFVSFLGLWWLSHVVKSAKRPPGPVPIPFIGNTHLLITSDLDKLAMRLTKKFGDIVEISVGGEPMVVVSGNEYARYVLNSDNFNIRWKMDEGLKELGMYERGLAFNSKIDEWKTQRKFFKNSIGGKFLYEVAPASIRNAKKLVEVLKENHTGKPFNIADYMQRLALDTIGELAFGNSFELIQKNEGNELAKSTDGFMKAWSYFVLTPAFVFRYLLFWKSEKHRKTIRTFQANANKIIKERRNAIAKDNSNSKLESDFLGALLRAHLTDTLDGELNNSEVEMLTREMLLGGSDTTSNTMTFILYWIARFPEVQEKMVQEYNRILNFDQDPSYEDLAAMTYTDQVINETSRITPGSSIIPRRAIESDSLGGYDIPAGTNICVNLISNNYNEKYWKDPEVFDPSRFAPENIKTNQYARQVYFPFGYGGKSCPGQFMAKVEMKAFLVILLRNFHFELEHPTIPLETEYHIVSQPKHRNLLMNVYRRNTDGNKAE